MLKRIFNNNRAMRISLPKEYLKKLDIKNLVNVTLENNKIIITKAQEDK